MQVGHCGKQGTDLRNGRMSCGVSLPGALSSPVQIHCAFVPEKAIAGAAAIATAVVFVNVVFMDVCELDVMFVTADWLVVFVRSSARVMTIVPNE